MFSFELYSDEKMVRVYRQSEWVLAKSVLAVFVAIYLPWYFLIKYGLMVEYRWYLLGWTGAVLLYFLHQWLVWLLKSYIVTNKRVIIVLYKNAFQKIVLETPLDRVTNVSFGTSGVLQSLLNFGDIYVQVAGVPDPFIMENIRQPSRIKDFLWKLQTGPVSQITRNDVQ